MKKFIKGQIILAEDVSIYEKFEEYQEMHKNALDQILEWKITNNVLMNISVTPEGVFFLEYKIVCLKLRECKQLKSELLKMLKAEWGKIKSVLEIEGETLW